MARPKKDVWDNFGFNLGFAAKPWIQVYGDLGQFKLAEAIAHRKKEIEYEGYYYSSEGKQIIKPGGVLKVPKAAAPLREQAYEYLSKAAEFHWNITNLQQEDWVTREEAVLRNIPAEQEKFNLKIVYGRRKILDERGQAQVDIAKEKLTSIKDPKERRKKEKELKALEESLKRPMWEVAYEQRHAYDLDPIEAAKSEKAKKKGGKGGKHKEGGGIGDYDYDDDDDEEIDSGHDEEDDLAETAHKEMLDLMEGKFDVDPDEYLTESEKRRLQALGLLEEYLAQYKTYPTELARYVETTHHMREDIYQMLSTNDKVRGELESMLGTSTVSRALRRAARRRNIPQPSYNPNFSTKKALEERIIKGRGIKIKRPKK